MKNEPLKNYISRIGVQALSDHLGVTPQAVRNAAARRSLPSAWFFSIGTLCAELDVDPIPRKFFSFKNSEAA